MKLAKSIFFLWLIPFLVFAESSEESSNLLSEEWSESWSLEALDANELTIPKASASLLDYVSIKVRSDLAYSGSLTQARGNVRLLSEGAPIENAYLKADIQVNYFHAKDDLLLEEHDEYTLKINEFWGQYSKDMCNLKVGRQSLFWGNVEGTQALDVIAPVDLTEPLLTDFSLIRRSQDILAASCFLGHYEFELLLIPKPLLDQYTARQSAVFEDLEKSLRAEWGARMTKHSEGVDLSLYYGRFIDNTPKTIFDINTFIPTGVYVSQFDLIGAGVVYAIERLLLELEFSYQKEHSFHSLYADAFLANKQFTEKMEMAIGAEYTTASNHQFSSGVWFYEYEKNPISSRYSDTYVLNSSWSKQYLNDDLTLSALVFWQKEPELYQFTFLADLLLNDYWSTSSALTYQGSRGIKSGSATVSESKSQNWTLQLSMAYEL